MEVDWEKHREEGREEENGLLVALGRHHLGCERGIFLRWIFWGVS